jgi:hypothetical protein
MYKIEDMFSSVVFEFATFYVGGCPVDSVPNGLKELVERILALLHVTSKFGEVIGSEGDIFADMCGTNLTTINAIGLAVEQQSCVLADTLLDIQDYFACGNFYPVYEIVVHKAVCLDGNEGFAWVAFPQLCIVFFSMIMLTLRVAFAETKEEEDEETRRKCRSWCKATLMCSRDTTERPPQERNEDEEKASILPKLS